MRPLVIRAHIYMPGKGGGRRSLRSAVAHLKYMGNPKKEELIRDDEALRDRGDTDEAAIHARYAGHRPGSTGLFGPDRDVPVNEAALAKELGDHKGPVWRLIVSVTEADARAMGGQLMGRPSWEDACRAAIPKMAQEMGIPAADLRWTAAMHRKEGHPHVHVLMWSADRERGYLNKRGLDASRRAWVSELYAPARDRLGTEKSQLRKDITEQSRLVLGRTDAADLGQQL
ncbi:hypothetical protein B2A_15821, partial [mine drainage metagenome]